MGRFVVPDRASVPRIRDGLEELLEIADPWVLRLVESAISSRLSRNGGDA